ncbi:VOC family protein [uncultured Brachybacterium sp.]|uniref:VOC family protein n=1 Tax=uncultured Brachybacterium sp. TaxID=189680 RepID=UPI002618ED99|nr:VOC family protein [uncultured Brachybacterium sp.]
MSENSPASDPAATDGAQSTAEGEAATSFTTGRPAHFEIQAADPQRAVTFYSTVFGWGSEDWSGFAGSPYFGVTTGTGHGIDGAVMSRPGGANPEVGGPVAGAVLTIGVEDYDATAAILAGGGTEALPKYALAGMAWQGYFHDTENNVFGIHQPDPEAA